MGKRASLRALAATSAAGACKTMMLPRGLAIHASAAQAMIIPASTAFSTSETGLRFMSLQSNLNIDDYITINIKLERNRIEHKRFSMQASLTSLQFGTYCVPN